MTTQDTVVYTITHNKYPSHFCELAINPPNELYDVVFFSVTFFPTGLAWTGPWHELKPMLEQFHPDTEEEIDLRDTLLQYINNFYLKHNLTATGHKQPV